MCLFVFNQKAVKNYAFEIPDVPAQSEYLEVRYSVSEANFTETLSFQQWKHITQTERFSSGLIWETMAHISKGFIPVFLINSYFY